jgi:hypothetical protein
MPAKGYKTSKRTRKNYKGTKTETKKTKVPTNATLAKRITKIQKDVELKYSDLRFNGGSISGGVITVLNDLTEGPAKNQRVGAMSRPTSIQFRGVIEAIAGRIAPSKLRMIIFWDSAPGGAYPNIQGNSLTGTQALLSNTIGVAASGYWALPYMQEMLGRIKILYDKTFTVNPRVNQTWTTGTPNQATGAYAQQVFFHETISLSRHVQHDGTGIGITSMIQNALNVVMIPDGTANFPNYDVYFRLYFKDN